MNLKKNKPFVLRSKTQEAHDRRFRGTLHLFMLLFAVGIPFLVSGVLGYIMDYNQSDIDYYYVNLFLFYFIPLATVIAQYLSYAVMAVSLCFFSVRDSRRLIIDYICGTVLAYLIIPVVQFIMLSGQDPFYSYNGFRTVFYAALITVYTLLLSFVLFRRGKKCADRFYASGSGDGKTAPIFSKENVIFKITLSVFGILLITGILLEFLQYTLPFLQPGAGSEAGRLDVCDAVEGYAILILQHVLGAAAMVTYGTYLHRRELRLRG